MEHYVSLSLSPCTNVRELLTGPSRDVRDALARARRTLVRSPSEAAVLDLIERMPSTLYRPSSKSRPAQRVIAAVARMSGWVLRNPRIPGCVSLLTSGDIG
jgi:hypothetical protein